MESKQIAAMYCTGYFTQAQIARRLGVSLKTVQRIIREDKEAKPQEKVLGITDTPEEKILWLAFMEAGATFGTIAYLFGVSKETVREYLLSLYLNAEITKIQEVVDEQ